MLRKGRNGAQEAERTCSLAKLCGHPASAHLARACVCACLCVCVHACAYVYEVREEACTFGDGQAQATRCRSSRQFDRESTPLHWQSTSKSCTYQAQSMPVPTMAIAQPQPLPPSLPPHMQVHVHTYTHTHTLEPKQLEHTHPHTRARARTMSYRSLMYGSRSSIVRTPSSAATALATSTGTPLALPCPAPMSPLLADPLAPPCAFPSWCASPAGWSAPGAGTSMPGLSAAPAVWMGMGWRCVGRGRRGGRAWGGAQEGGGGQFMRAGGELAFPAQSPCCPCPHLCSKWTRRRRSGGSVLTTLAPHWL